MTDERQLAVAYLGVTAVCAVAVSSQAGLALVALSLVALLVGYIRKATSSAAAAGLFLYYPLTVAFGHFIPGGWSYVAAAVLLIPLSERLSFEYYLSSALEAPLGVDEESRRLAAKLSRSHGVKLLWYTCIAGAVSALSLVAYTFTPYSYVLVAASVLLVLALWWYSGR